MKSYIVLRTLYQAECSLCTQIKQSSNKAVIDSWANHHDCAIRPHEVYNQKSREMLTRNPNQPYTGGNG